MTQLHITGWKRHAQAHTHTTQLFFEFLRLLPLQVERTFKKEEGKKENDKRENEGQKKWKKGEAEEE